MNQASANGKVPKIRVLVVDDSPIAIEIVRRMLATAPEIEVVGTASNGAEALELIPQVRPDVICTDLHMPKMDGVELTRIVMTRSPLPILVLSVSVQAEQEHNIFQMLEAGALDILAKPRGGLESDFGITAHDLITKIKILSGVKVIGRRGASANAITQPIPTLKSFPVTSAPRIVGIGASTGGPQALGSGFSDNCRETTRCRCCACSTSPKDSCRAWSTGWRVAAASGYAPRSRALTIGRDRVTSAE